MQSILQFFYALGLLFNPATQLI
jgi:hypothetical protein